MDHGLISTRSVYININLGSKTALCFIICFQRQRYEKIA